MSAFGESVVEQAALAWLESAGRQLCSSAATAPAGLHVNDVERFVAVVA